MTICLMPENAACWWTMDWCSLLILQMSLFLQFIPHPQVAHFLSIGFFIVTQFASCYTWVRVREFWQFRSRWFLHESLWRSQYFRVSDPDELFFSSEEIKALRQFRRSRTSEWIIFSSTSPYSGSLSSSNWKDLRVGRTRGFERYIFWLPEFRCTWWWRGEPVCLIDILRWLLHGVCFPLSFFI